MNIFKEMKKGTILTINGIKGYNLGHFYTLRFKLKRQSMVIDREVYEFDIINSVEFINPPYVFIIDERVFSDFEIKVIKVIK